MAGENRVREENREGFGMLIITDFDCGKVRLKVCLELCIQS